MKKMLKLVLAFIVGFFVFTFGQVVYETIAVKRETKKFMAKGVLQEDISTDEIKYYVVSRETFYPDELERTPFYKGNLKYPGDEGDLFVTRFAPFPDKPVVYQFVSFYFGGHAGYVGPDNLIYETYGIPNADENFLDVIINGGRNTHVSTKTNYWLNPNHNSESDVDYPYFGSYYRKEWIGLRVKGITQEEIEETTTFMETLKEEKAQYNFFFVLFTKNKYYCTDMMSRAFGIFKKDGKMKYNLNMDGFAVTVNDLILSNDTYISYYVMTDFSGVKHVYFVD